MPVMDGLKFKPLSEEEFHLLDYEMMDLVFSVHRDLGPLFCDEKIYQNELAYRCTKKGFAAVETEAPVCVCFKDFTKTYYMDLLINKGAMYELKAVKCLSGEHRKQAINYLLLAGLNHGKLVNMRPQSVEHEFVSTRLTARRRHQLTFHDDKWQDLDRDGAWLKQLMFELLSDWGAFLDTELFYDAVRHFRGPDTNILGRINVFNGKRVLGTQRAHLLNATTAFKISSVTHNASCYERHLQRFLRHTCLKAIQWINFDHHEITFTTIRQ